MQASTQAVKQSGTAAFVIGIELLALDLNSCIRCVGTLEHIEKSIVLIRPVMEVLETRVNLKRIVVESENKARQYGFVTSPTIRINGNDIVFETLESECESCTDLCGCDVAIRCRVWRYRGEEYTQAPVGLIVESILREILGVSHAAAGLTPVDTGLSENLRRFYRGKFETRPAEDCCFSAKKGACCERTENVAHRDASPHETSYCQ